MALGVDTRLTVDSPQARGSGLLFWVLLLIVVAVAYQMQRAVALLGLDLHHDTVVFDAARRLVLGELPFKDFFYQYNLGTLLLHAQALEAFGMQIASLKVVTVYAYVLIAILIYTCGTVGGERWWAFVTALLWSTLSPFYMPALSGYHAWATVYMMAAVMLGALCLMIALRQRPLFWAVLSGASLNLAFWFKQVAGLQILIVLIWIIYQYRHSAEEKDARKFREIFIGVAAGGLLSAFPFFAYLVGKSLFFDWWRSAFVFNGFFATSGHSASHIGAFVLTVFPVAHDLGYWSFVWALLPLCLVVLLLQRNSEDGRHRLFRMDQRSRGMLLFAGLAIAGWIEYFPLAHAFHTHMFMAPMFVLLATQRSTLVEIEWRAVPRSYVWPIVFYVSIAAMVYESALHIRGVREKSGASTRLLLGDSPARGLRLAPEHARSFNVFYEAMIKAGKTFPNRPFVPMSVDPLRALLPYVGGESEEFKMGVNWTWPNEIVEPGFNTRLAQRIAERQSPVYADSFIAIPGYMLTAVLEMPSPMTATHTLYVPSTDSGVVAAQLRVVEDNTVEVLSLTFPKAERPLISQSKEQVPFTLLKFGNINDIGIQDIADVHVAAFTMQDIPDVLSKLQYEQFLAAEHSELAAKVRQLYELNRSGKYELKLSMEHDEIFAMAKFMLSQGKLFEGHGKPAFFSTLVSIPERRPFLATTVPGDAGFRVLWAKSPIVTNVPDAAKRTVSLNHWLAIPSGTLYTDEDAILYVQFVMKNGTTRNFFLDYRPA